MERPTDTHVWVCTFLLNPLKAWCCGSWSGVDPFAKNSDRSAGMMAVTGWFAAAFLLGFLGVGFELFFRYGAA